MPAKKTHEQVLADHSVQLPNGCVLWIGCRDKDGYGKCSRKSIGVFTSHKLAYWLRNGGVPVGFELDHTCKNRSCCNPDHLDLVSHAENVRRSERPRHTHRNGRKTHCIRGHSLTGSNLIIEVWKDITMRKCRACRDAKNAAYRVKIKET